VNVGNEAGWALSFHPEVGGAVVDESVLTIGSENYDAEIEATLPSGLDGGVYRFTVAGMTPEDHAQIAQRTPDQPTVARLYLYWRDAAPAALLPGNLAELTDRLAAAQQRALEPALVAELAVTSVSRRLGERTIETTVEARERAFVRLKGRRLAAAVKKNTLSETAVEVGARAGVTVTAVGFRPDGSLPPRDGQAPPDETTTKDPGTSCWQALSDLGAAVEQQTGMHGRGMALIRNGRVSFGPRPIPENGTTPTVLTLHEGLIEVEAVASATSDPNFDPDDDRPGKDGEARQFKLTLKGRPDLRPGDLVVFDLPPTEATSTAEEIGANNLAALNPLAGDSLTNPATLYVASVDHRLGRTSAFSTTLTGVVVDPADAWDRHSDGGSQSPRSDSGSNGTAAHPAVEAANAIRELAQGAVDSARSTEIGEVRESHERTTDGAVSQTVDVYRGLQPPDGLPRQARRLPVRREKPARVEGVATATPFAWGKCGLVVPRYPGTRLVLVHRNGSADDPVEIGAVWESGRGPDSQPGDWWLTLPAGFDGDRRSVPEEQDPGEHTGKVSNDLIDADGKRVIQVAGLTVSVGPDSLTAAGERPGPPADAVVTIENADKQAHLTIDAEGTITIHAAKDLVLEADGDIKLDAANVEVSVSGTMDVR
jgi:hypothetical protein